MPGRHYRSQGKDNKIFWVLVDTVQFLMGEIQGFSFCSQRGLSVVKAEYCEVFGGSTDVLSCCEVWLYIQACTEVRSLQFVIRFKMVNKPFCYFRC